MLSLSETHPKSVFVFGSLVSIVQSMSSCLRLRELSAGDSVAKGSREISVREHKKRCLSAFKGVPGIHKKINRNAGD